MSGFSQSNRLVMMPCLNIVYCSACAMTSMFSNTGDVLASFAEIFVVSALSPSVGLLGEDEQDGMVL